MPRVDELLEQALDREAQHRLAEVQRLADQVVPAVDHGVRAGGEVLEDRDVVEGFKRQVPAPVLAFRPVAVDDHGPLQAAQRLQQRAERRAGLVHEDVFPGPGSYRRHGRAEHGRQEFVHVAASAPAAAQRRMEETDDEVPPREVEQQVIVEHRQRPAQPLGRRHRVAAGLEDVRVVERHARQPRAAARDGQVEFPVADGEVRLEIVDDAAQSREHGWEFHQPPGDLADHARHRHPALVVDRAQDRHLVDAPAPAAFAHGLRHPPAADEQELVFR